MAAKIVCVRSLAVAAAKRQALRFLWHSGAPAPHCAKGSECEEKPQPEEGSVEDETVGADPQRGGRPSDQHARVPRQPMLGKAILPLTSPQR